MGALLSSIKKKKRSRDQRLHNGTDSSSQSGSVDHMTDDVSKPQRLTSGFNTPSPKPRHHPYDEIDDKHIVSNRLALAKKAEEDSGISLSSPEQPAPNSAVTYCNWTPPSAKSSDDVEYVNNVDGLYSKVNKVPKVKAQQTADTSEATLNYIEVEIVPSQRAPKFKPEEKSPEKSPTSSSCTYTEIIRTDGKMVVLSD